jgi:hypothetical protein
MYSTGWRSLKFAPRNFVDQYMYAVSSQAKLGAAQLCLSLAVYNMYPAGWWSSQLAPRFLGISQDQSRDDRLLQ